MSENFCSNCGHPQSDHDGIGKCQATIEQGKAFFECTCMDFEEGEGA